MHVRTLRLAILEIVALLSAFACGGGDDPAAVPHGGASSTAASGGGGGTGGGTGGEATSSSAGGAGAGGAPDACAERAATFQALLDAARTPAKAPGAVLAISTRECGLWTGASGMSTEGEPMKPDHVLRIGSVTKTFVSTTVLELVEEGELTLDDTLEQHVPGFPGGEGITVTQLLSHTSGIFNYTETAAFWDVRLADPKKVWAHDELVALAAAEPPYFAPGAGWHYSNTNYILLGMIVETLVAAPIGETIRTRLLDPLSLTSTSFDGEERIVGDLAHGTTESGFDVSTYLDPSWAWSAGAMVSSVGDLVTWAEKLYGGAVLQPSSLEAMLEPFDTDNPGIHYGLGAFIFEPAVAGDIAYGHAGSMPGYHTEMIYFPNKGVTLATIVNSDLADTNPIVVAVIEELIL